jgi:hypothetical protein
MAISSLLIITLFVLIMVMQRVLCEVRAKLLNNIYINFSLLWVHIRPVPVAVRSNA